MTKSLPPRSEESFEPPGLPPSQRINIFFRFKEYIMRFIRSFENSKNIDLVLMEDVQNNAIEILFRLNDIKEDLRLNMDGKLFTYVEDVVDPLALKIKLISKRLSTEKQQIEDFDYWMKNMVTPQLDFLASKTDDREAIESAVVTFAVEHSSQKIETDLKVIREDHIHKIDNLAVPLDERKNLEMRMEQALAGLTQQWRELKKPPSDLTIEKLSAWKVEVDAKRTKYYHRAMDTIDRIIPDAKSGINEKMHEHLLLNFQKIVELENEIPLLFQKIGRGELSKEDLNIVQKKLRDLDDIKHHLHLDLQLTPEMVDRLSLAENSLKTIHQLLEEDL